MENSEKTRLLFAWMCAVIETCAHDLHFEAVDNLIELFRIKTDDEAATTELKLLRNKKWDDIHFILR